MKRFCIYTNRHKDKDLLVTEKIKLFLEQKGLQCVVRFPKEGLLPEDADCILVLGGDGTMLQAAREISGNKRIPLLGVNLGTLGYLAEVEPEGIIDALNQLICGDYELESRMMLNGCIHRSDGTEQRDFALNDIVINRSVSSQVLVFNLFVNKKFLNKYLADGMIVTTPTGSTAYNLSAGGPIVEPSAKLIVVTPICPHTMNQRSVILSPEDEVVLEIPMGREGQEQVAAANFDGCAVEVRTGDKIRIVQSERTTDFIKLSKAGFLEVLHKKLSDN